MKVTDIFEGYDYTASEARADEAAGAVKEEMWKEFNKRFTFIYDDLDSGFWFDDKLRPEFKGSKEDPYLPKKQHEILYRYISKLEHQAAAPTEAVKTKITNFINKFGTTFSMWSDSNEGEQIKNEIEYDMADEKSYKKDPYAYYGVSRKDFY